MRKVHFIYRKEYSETSLKRIYEIAREIGPSPAYCFKRKRKREAIKVEKLKEHQKKYLKELANPLNPAFFIGDKRMSYLLLCAIDEALSANELIKLKFLVDQKNTRKLQMCDLIGKKTGCEVVTVKDHFAIIYRQNQKANKRKIKLP